MARKNRVKIDKILDKLSQKTEKNINLEFIKWISPPNYRTQNDIVEWFSCRLESINSNDKIYISDIVRWKEKNADILTGVSARLLHNEQGKWIGIDPYLCLSSILGQIINLMKRLENDSEIDIKKIYLIEKLAGRAANTAEAIALIEKQIDKKEIGIGFAVELANFCNSQALQDANATPQMREWLNSLMKAGIQKIQER